MTRQNKQILYLCLLVAAILALLPFAAEAQRTGGSSRPSSPPPSRPSPPPAAQRPAPAQQQSRPPAQQPAQASGRTGGSQGGSPAASSSGPSSRTSTGQQPTQQQAKAPQSQADKAMADKARQQGTYYQSRSQAQQDYRQKYGSSHPTTFDREPQQRPDYIPQTYSSNGGSYTIVYSPQYHGYGYMNGGVWVSYDDVLMAQQGYYVDDGPVYASRGGGYISIGGAVVLIALIIVAGVVFTRILR